jgi:hypothetical protein
MIYVANEWLSAKEASDQLTLSKGSHQLFKVRCDLKVSEKCRNEYEIEYREFLKHISNNNGKLPCIYCSRTSKNSGRNNPNTKYKTLDDNFFKIIDTTEKAYLFGWIASDGHIGVRGFKISINQKDLEILKVLQNIICKEVPIRKFTKDGSEMCSYEINSRQISRDLCRHLNIKPGKKSDVINFPVFSSEFQLDFIRGYFDGDGWINDLDKSKYPYPKGTIRSDSNLMLKGIQKFCDGVGSISCGALQLSNRKIMLFLDSLYKNGGPRLNRKYQRYMKWKNKNVIKT